MDILNDVLDTLDLKGALYFRTDFSGEWATQVPQFAQAARFHLVVQGHCHVQTASGARFELTAGDLILLPGGRAHILSSHREFGEAPPLESVLEAANYSEGDVLVVGDGDSDAAVKLVCGHFDFRRGARHPLLSALPESAMVRAGGRARHPLLDEMLTLIARRMFAEEIGSRAAVRRLSEIVFIEILRSSLPHNAALEGVLGAMRDEQIGRALQAMHSRPDKAWTVDALAGEAGMSRSRFAERFRALMGCAPMSYLSDWRLQKSLALLQDTGLSVQEVAVEAGYLSPAAFSRAFSGKFGAAPSDFRREGA